MERVMSRLNSLGVRLGITTFVMVIGSYFITPIYGNPLTNDQRLLLAGLAAILFVLGEIENILKEIKGGS